MTTTYETAVTLVAQLSPVDQARLVVLLAERLQHTLQTEPAPVDADAPAFWNLSVDDDTWAALATPRVAVPPSAAPAQAATEAMLTRWFGAPLPDEDARDLAMSSSIAEWNVDQ